MSNNGGPKNAHKVFCDRFTVGYESLPVRDDPSIRAERRVGTTLAPTGPRDRRIGPLEEPSTEILLGQSALVIKTCIVTLSRRLEEDECGRDGDVERVDHAEHGNDHVLIRQREANYQ